MIYCLIKGSMTRVFHTHANSQGQITTFLYNGKGNCSPNSFNLKDFENVESFLKSEYKATILPEILYPKTN